MKLVCKIKKKSNMNNSNFLILACENLTTYITPQTVLDFIEKEKIKSIIGNPPYVVR